MKPGGPVEVRRVPMTRILMRGSQPAFYWRCSICKRRGYHRSGRVEDRLRERWGQPPDRHPWLRAMDGALRHLHEKHTPCTCCGAGGHRPTVGRAA